MRALEHKVPPPLVVIVSALVMFALARLLPSLTFSPRGAQAGWAAALAVLGIIVAVTGVYEFWKAKTTVNPLRVDATSALVTGGVFRLSRNPMYLGMLLILIAWAVWLGNVAATLGLPLFVAYIHRFQITPEERSMRALFGTAFDAYARKTRRWL